MEENVLNAVTSNRRNLAIIGANLGGQFHQVDVRPSILNFAEESARIAAEGNVELYLNRTPKRYRMLSRNIINIGTKADITGQPVVFINQDEKGLAEIQIPFSSDMKDFAVINDDALKAAMKGDKSKIFADPEKLAMQVNSVNYKEIKNIDNMIKMLTNFKKGIEDTIAENNSKVITYKRELGLNNSDKISTAVEVNVEISGE